MYLKHDVSLFSVTPTGYKEATFIPAANTDSILSFGLLNKSTLMFGGHFVE